MLNRYYPITSGMEERENGIPYIHVWVSYTKGGYNRERGYYLHASPVHLIKRETYTTEVGLPMRGGFFQLFTVTRASKGAEQKANAMAEMDIKDILDITASKNDLTYTMDCIL